MVLEADSGVDTSLESRDPMYGMGLPEALALGQLPGAALMLGLAAEKFGAFSFCS